MISSKKRPNFFIALLLVTIFIVLALLFDVIPFLRGGFGWRWPYTAPTMDTLLRLIPGAAALIIYLVGVQLLREKPTPVYLTWVFVNTITITLSFLAVQGNPFYLLYTRTVSGLTTGAYLLAADYASVPDLLQQWPAYMTTDRLVHTHLSISPPGWPALYLLTTRLLEMFPGLSAQLAAGLRPLQCHNLTIMSQSNAQIASAWLGILSPVWGALTIFPLYYLGRQLYTDREARYVIVWWAMVPALSMFMGTLNTPYPFLAVTTLIFLVRGLNRANLWLIGLSGAFTGISLTINFSLVPLGLMSGLLILLYPRSPGRQWFQLDWYAALRAGAAFATGFGALLGAYWLLSGHALHALLPLAMDQHLGLERPYLPWIWLHTWDVVLFVGLPIFGLFVLSCFKVLSGKPHRFLTAIALSLIIMVLSGTARGETGRVWLFFMPLFLLGIPPVLAGHAPKWRMALISTQLIWLFALTAILNPVGTGLSAPPDYAQIAPQPIANQPLIPVSAVFGDALQLQGFQAEYDQQTNALSVVLNWQVNQPITHNYLFSALAVAPDGTIPAVIEWLPLDYQYPTTCWQPDAGQVVDKINIPLPEQPQSGDWWLSLSAFTLAEGNPPNYLPVTLPNGTIDPQQTGIGPIPILKN
ncbi:MAG: hypothetical protein R3D55_28695 [Chloroflexota bacterium]